MNPVVFKSVLIEQISHPVLTLKASEESLEVDFFVLPHLMSVKKCTVTDPTSLTEESKTDENITPKPKTSSDYEDRNLEDIESMLDLTYEKDLTITVLRNVSNKLLIKSACVPFELLLSFESNVDRDLATILLRRLH